MKKRILLAQENSQTFGWEEARKNSLYRKEFDKRRNFRECIYIEIENNFHEVFMLQISPDEFLKPFGFQGGFLVIHDFSKCDVYLVSN